MEKFEIASEQNKNFKNLEDKIKIVISECNSKTLNRVDSTFLPDGVRNANYGEQHILDNGLYVYIFYNDNQPINYWISSSSLYFLEENGKSIRYSGANGIEYTSGGFGNGLAFNSTKNFNEI